MQHAVLADVLWQADSLKLYTKKDTPCLLFFFTLYFHAWSQMELIGKQFKFIFFIDSDCILLIGLIDSLKYPLGFD